MLSLEPLVAYFSAQVVVMGQIFALALLGVPVQSAVGEDVRFRTLNLANLREDGRRALRSSGSDLSLETIEERLKGDGLCPPAEIANSNRNWTSPCNGLKQQGWAPTGTECEYTCDEGYIPIGRHVCQWHNVVQVNGSTGERSVNEAELEHSFWGGRCQRLCSQGVKFEGNGHCNSSQSVRRYRDVDADGECFATKCFESGLDNLENVAQGVYTVVKNARDEETGYYRDSTLEYGRDDGPARYSLDATGLGMMAEAVACELQYQTMREGLRKVSRTVDSLLKASLLETSFKRDPRGFFSHYTGSQTRSSPMATGIFVACALFVKKYFLTNAANQNTGLREDAADLAALVDTLYASVDFTQILCDFNTSRVSPNGTGIPFTMSVDGMQCGSRDDPNGRVANDTMYQFTEEHNAVYLAYQQACGSQRPGECDNEAIELMWNRWQGRRLNPSQFYQGFNVSSTWSSYVTQLVYYTSQSFNDDPGWMNLYVQGWEADRLFYKQHYFQGLRGRYGLGKGPEEEWCSEAEAGFAATRMVSVAGTLTPGKRKGIRKSGRKHCQVYSADVVAAWLPARSGMIKHNLLELLEDGETVVPLAGTDLAVLWRSSMLDPVNSFTTGHAARLTLIDLIPEMFGIASLWLDGSFFQNCAHHMIVLYV